MWRLFIRPEKKVQKRHVPTREEREEQWYRYFYETHPRLEMKEWARRMSIFRFCRANADQTGERDRLMAAVRFSSREELEETCALLGIPLTEIPSGSDAAGVSERVRVQPYPELRQPGHIRLMKLPAHVWIQSDRIAISLFDADDPTGVTGRTIKSAAAIESRLEAFKDRLIDPPLKDRHCLCPKFYPDLFPDAAE
ncbi:hypothetical protein QWJ34_00055 [Saccharibacillus sp. CPCC 101409]|uniref:hypothetical protein n=1 Tax=Saccharibacillus sp. CPCC 101409 TaxID=3058041 RepID=UPI002673BF39|nr:hypothetical protein [Saccharibacillus sp. CPCC 101409]MDO3408148.1 hypothetical protein [Saccharibacillus sp. CPCC 101409]